MGTPDEKLLLATRESRETWSCGHLKVDQVKMFKIIF